jgi:DNA-binding winged helix-turn-helix (wHTH) protein/TolB-like protein/tetratricopeptide (TPR) repeat protein
VYEFGPFRLEPIKRILYRDGEPIALPPKAFDALLILVANGGRVVERHELIEKLWPDTFVEEINLNVQISLVRKALGEQPNQHRYIVTVPRRGYSFVAEVSEIQNSVADKSAREDFLSAKTVEEADIAEAHLQSKPGGEAKVTLAWLPAGFKHRGTILLLAAVFTIMSVVSFAWIRAKNKEPELRPAGGSIAILPFKHLTSKEEEYLGVGIADALITKLSNIDQINVRPTSAVLKYGDVADPLTAGRELGVDLLLEGKIQLSDDRIRVTVHMLRVSDGAALWADSFDESYTNIFGVEDAISRRVAEAVKTNLNVVEKKSLGKHHTENTRAYHAYIRGRYHWNKRTGEGLRKAIEHFNEAIMHDPQYALAYAGLADSYNLTTIFASELPENAYPKAKEAAMKAIGLDNTLAEGYTSLAYAKMRYDWDWAGAGEDFKRALDLAPGYATAHHWHAEYLMLMGRVDEARAEFERALELDPLSIIINSDFIWGLYYGRDYDGAIRQAQKTLELDPEFIPARLALILAYEEKGMYREALAGFEHRDMGKMYWSRLGHLLAASGRKSEALKLASKYSVFWKDEPRLSLPVAGIYASLGDNDQALGWLEKAYQDRLELLIYLNVDPRFDILRSDVRFQDLLRRIGLN